MDIYQKRKYNKIMVLSKRYLIIIIVVVLALISSLFLFDKEEKIIVFFSGAGMKVPVTEIIKDFSEKTGIKVVVHFEGSSILRQHIERYGDADIFMSGDRENIDILINEGFVKESSFMAWHIPAILVPSENIEKIKGLNDLSRKGISFVMSNPRLAASGRMAYEAISRHPMSREILNNVAAYSSSTQESLKIFRDLHEKGQADAVIEWDVMVHVPEGRGLFVVPFEKEYEIRDSIIIALLKKSSNPDISKIFYDYLKKEGREVFKRHGYNTEANQ